MIAATANLITRAVRAGHHHRAWLSGLALVLILAMAATYVLVGALGVSPLTSSYRITVELADSGGLLPRQDVALRGVPIGRVESLNLTPNGVNAVVTITSTVKIPVSSAVRVSALSPAGEQYVDFAPASDSGPYLSDGSVIRRNHTTTPVPLSQLLADGDGVLSQTDPKKIVLIKKELSMSKQGPDKLAAIVDGGTFLLATLDSVLPETTSILKTSRTVLTLAADKNAGLAATSTNLAHLLNGVSSMDGGYRRLLDNAPQTLSSLDNLFADNSDTMVQLLGNLATVAKLSYVRVPALNALFPNYRGSMLEALAGTMHDHGLWATADLYPRYVCDYGTPREIPSSGDYAEPYVYASYCPTDDPGVLIRGAKNAPRPGGDDTAGPPRGADLTQKSDPTPKGRFTVPTPFGGPPLPIEPPH